MPSGEIKIIVVDDKAKSGILMKLKEVPIHNLEWVELFADFLEKCTTVDPLKRLTASQAL